MKLIDLLSIYVANGVGIYILLILVFASHTKILRDRPEDRIYTLMCFGIIGGCFFEGFSYTIDGHLFTGARLLNYFANTYLYSFNVMLSLMMIFYVDLGIYGKHKNIWRKYKLQVAIAVAMVLLNVINFFVPVIYDISAHNVYSRRPLSYVYYVVIIYFLIIAMLVEKKYERDNGARSFFNINMFIIPVVIGVCLQFMVYGLSLAWLSCAIGLVGLYMMQQNELAFVDPLVETYNRQYLNFILDSWIKRGDSFIGAMLDIDYFKSINDTYGHTEGDRALKTVSDILKASRKDNEWVFRFAGDEFVVLKVTDKEDDLDDYLKEVERRVKEFNKNNKDYELSVSYGTCIYKNDDLDSFVKEMDRKMYEMKALHHREATSEA